MKKNETNGHDIIFLRNKTMHHKITLRASSLITHKKCTERERERGEIRVNL
jgi:hypothetical protein